MCEVTTAIAVGSLVVGGMMQGAAAQDAANDEARAMQQDAAAERVAAADAVARGAGEAGKARMEGSTAVAENKVALASSGVDVQSGSALDILEGTRALSELDVQTIANNARREAWGHEVRAVQLDNAARRTREQGGRAATGSFLSTLGSVGSFMGSRGGRR